MVGKYQPRLHQSQPCISAALKLSDLFDYDASNMAANLLTALRPEPERLCRQNLSQNVWV
jgi:hypothetical protein